jgi:hypothetical protein
MNARLAEFTLLLSLVFVTGCSGSNSEPPPAFADEGRLRAAAVAFHVVAFRTSSGQTLRADGSQPATRSDALLASASHDLECPSESVRSIDRVSPRRTMEYAFDGCGKRAVYRTAVSRGASDAESVEIILLVNVFPIPP